MSWTTTPTPPVWRAEPMTQAGRVLAGARLVLASGLAAAASFDLGGLGERPLLVWLCGGVWLPIAAAALLHTDRRPRPWRLAAAAADVVMLVAVQWLAPVDPALVLFLGLLLIVPLGYLDGWRVGWLCAASIAIGSVLADLDGGYRTVHAAAALAYFVGTAVADAAGRARRRDRLAMRHEAARAQTILDSVADGVVVTTGDGKVRACNLAAARLLGAGRDPMGQACATALGLHTGTGPLDCSEGCALLAAEGEGHRAGVEVWRTGPDGERRPFLVSVSTVEPGGEHAEVVHSLRDITTLKEAEEAKSLFLATASHELKTPVSFILGFAELLLDSHTGSDDDRRALEAIRARARELIRIVERLLTASRIDAGRIDVHLEAVDLAALVRERAWAFAAARQVTVDVEDCDAPVAAWADSAAVETILDHLLENAVKYSSSDVPVRVRVEAAPRPRLSVSDQGIGMTPAQAARCFDKFWQAGVVEGRRGPGTGVGLYIVRSFAEAMGGTVSVDSIPGLGSTFTLGLPAEAAARTDDPADVDTRPSEIREFMRQLGLPTPLSPSKGVPR